MGSIFGEIIFWFWLCCFIALSMCTMAFNKAKLWIPYLSVYVQNYLDRLKFPFEEFFYSGLVLKDSDKISSNEMK